MATTTSLQAPSTTTVTSTTTAVAGLPPLLVADGDGIRVVEDGEVTATFLVGVAVERALPDLGGGVVYQETATGSWQWAWDDSLGRIVLDVTEGSGPPPIMSVSAPGSFPVVVVAAGGAVPNLQQVVRLDGRPAVLYSVATAEERASCGVEECVMHELMLRRLETGEVLDLGTVAGFESSIVRYVLGDSLMVVITQSYGEQDVCGAIWPRQELLEVGGSGVWIGEGGPFWRRCEFGSQVPPTGWGCEHGCMNWLLAAVAADGATIAYVEVPLSVAPVASLVVLDAATGDEVRRVEIDAAIDEISSLDWDGSSALLGRGSDAAPVVVASDGTVYEIDATWAAFWK
jgi:hypothetical protein